MVLLPGCGHDPRDNIPGGHAPQAATETVNELDLAMKIIATMPTSKDNASSGKALFNFNQWILQVPPPAEKFDPDPLLAHLPRAYDNAPPLQKLDRRNFEFSD